MTYKTLLLTALAAILFLQCAIHKNSGYNLPVTATETQKKTLLDQCKKGKELYKVNCSECHGIFTAGKDKVPNFSEKQIDNYTAKFLRHDARNHAIAKKMSPEQMNDILMFLRYRKTDKKSTKKTPKKTT